MTEEHEHKRKSDTFWFKLAPLVFGLVGSLIGPLVLVGMYRERITAIVDLQKSEVARVSKLSTDIGTQDTNLKLLNQIVTRNNSDIEKNEDRIRDLERIVARMSRDK